MTAAPLSLRASVLLLVATLLSFGCESEAPPEVDAGTSSSEGAVSEEDDGPDADRERRTEEDDTGGTDAREPPSPDDAGSGGPSVDASVGIEEDFGFVRHRAIADLADIREPSGDASSTMALGRRSSGGRRRVAEGIEVRTECGRSYCVDGLFAGGTPMLQPIPTQKPGGEDRLERVVRVTWATDDYVSAYIATSRSSGDAGADNDLRCRTFDRETGDVVALGEILEPSTSDRLLAKAEGLLEAERAMAVLGRRIEGAGMEFGPADYRFARTSGYRGIEPEIVLCGDGGTAGGPGTILEMQLEEFPVGYLLRPLAE